MVMVALLGRLDSGRDDSTNRNETEALNHHNPAVNKVRGQAAHTRVNGKKKKYSINRILDIDNIRNH
jgi:hypothetical protein